MFLIILNMYMVVWNALRPVLDPNVFMVSTPVYGCILTVQLHYYLPCFVVKDPGLKDLFSD